MAIFNMVMVDLGKLYGCLRSLKRVSGVTKNEFHPPIGKKRKKLVGVKKILIPCGNRVKIRPAFNQTVCGAKVSSSSSVNYKIQKMKREGKMGVPFPFSSCENQ